MKKVLSLVLALIMCLSLVSFASAEGYSGEIVIWVAEAAVEFTKAQVEIFKQQNPEYAGITATVRAMGSDIAVTEMIKDVYRGADLYVFSQDQLARLAAAGALIDVEPGTAEIIAAENDAGAVAAVTLGAFRWYPPLIFITLSMAFLFLIVRVVRNCFIAAISTLNAICEALDCQPGDILEFTSDK